MAVGTKLQEPERIAASRDTKAETRWRLDRIVAELRTSRDVTHNIWKEGPVRRAPSRDALETVLNGLVEGLFPRHYGRSDLDTENIDYFVGNTLNVALNALLEQVRRGQLVCSDGQSSWIRPCRNSIQLTLPLCVHAAGNPRCTRQRPARGLRRRSLGQKFPEILIGYPGMLAVIHHRLAHVLHRLGATLVARLIAEIAHTKTGIDIHPGASIGASFFVDHGTGVVIGETAVSASACGSIRRSAGSAAFPDRSRGQSRQGSARHPVVEDDVIIYAGATILGRIVIGRGSTIGGNVWLTRTCRRTVSSPRHSFQQGNGR